MPRSKVDRDPNLDHIAVLKVVELPHHSNHLQLEGIIASVKNVGLYDEVLRQFMLEVSHCRRLIGHSNDSEKLCPEV
jgi:hypothetical protein